MTSRRKSSVLSRQKAKRSRGGKRNWLKPVLFGILAAGVIAAGIFGYRQLAPVFRGRPPRLTVTPWKLDIKLVAGEALAPDLARDVLGIADDGLGDGEPRDLRMVAEEIQKAGSFASVHIVRTGAKQAVIRIEPRVPLLCLDANRLYYVTAAGDAYLPGHRAKIETCPGPIIRGVFDEDEAVPGLADDLALHLSDETRTRLKHAADLLAAARELGLEPARFDFEPYRGYSLTMSAPEGEAGLVVAIGRAPFADRLTKLKDLLDKLASKNEQAARIELDYQGKAFIKLKKM